MNPNAINETRAGGSLDVISLQHSSARNVVDTSHMVSVVSITTFFVNVRSVPVSPHDVCTRGTITVENCLIVQSRSNYR